MRTMIVTLACTAAALGGCTTTAHSVPTNVPILVGPVGHIGGKPVAVDESQDTDQNEVDFESSMDLVLCVNTAYPTVSVSHPDAAAGPQAIGAAYAHRAGLEPLGRYIPRLDELDVGAWESFVAGCYSHSYWWSVDGHLEKVK